ncbi:MAG: hypothetical protein HY901_34545 [Deltaproteobacteria bacterium]|nr:hypothetical protein [Deltaproteobacteria bacterium]
MNRRPWEAGRRGRGRTWDHANVNADQAVALGAAICASTIDKVSSLVLILKKLVGKR